MHFRSVAFLASHPDSQNYNISSKSNWNKHRHLVLVNFFCIFNRLMKVWILRKLQNDEICILLKYIRKTWKSIFFRNLFIFEENNKNKKNYVKISLIFTITPLSLLMSPVWNAAEKNTVYSYLMKNPTKLKKADL